MAWHGGRRAEGRKRAKTDNLPAKEDSFWKTFELPALRTSDQITSIFSMTDNTLDPENHTDENLLDELSEDDFEPDDDTDVDDSDNDTNMGD